MRVSDFDYVLPEQLIAQEPLPQRDACRLLVLDRTTGSLAHRHFFDLPEILRPDDLLVVNDSKVLPARLFGRKTTGGRVEVLLLRRITPESWWALTRPGLRPGQAVHFGATLAATVAAVEADGQCRLGFNQEGPALDEAIHLLGQLPVPPYIKTPLAHPEDYQTVYAREEGSVAAPTAGLHFSPELLDRLAGQGIEVARLTLHVGIGTFRPMKVDEVAQHHMHAEAFEVSPTAAELINRAQRSGRRVVAVGTTVVRTLEAIADESGQVVPGRGETSLFIVPGYRFRCVDALITNFHLPRSTLLMLVAALAGRDRILAAYQTAVESGYRFYSFGDAMLIQ
jgi:S-adenosylmethionine:tRNA ribosyltransferase-isomerase